MQEGEHPALSRPITENLNAVLQLLQYSAVRACLQVGGQSVAVLVRLPLVILAADWPPTSCVRLQISELSLSGNQMRADMQRRRLRFQAGDSLSNSTWTDGSGGGGGGGGGAAVDGRSSSDEGELARLRAGAEIIDCRSEWAGCCSAVADAVAWVKPWAASCGLQPCDSHPPRLLPAGGCVDGELLVTLKPMEIRTFELRYRPY